MDSTMDLTITDAPATDVHGSPNLQTSTPLARREHNSVLAAGEKRMLIWMAERTPRWINSDHLTLLGLLGMVLAGISYWMAAENLLWLHAVNVALLINWLGDSLDGTLARVRNRQRPRYGFYVDHVVDTFGALFLVGGMAASGLMSPGVAASVLIAYYVLAIDSYLATHALGVFRISMGGFGPTELRILIAVGNLFIISKPVVSFLGEKRLFLDVAGVGAVVVLGCIALFSIARNTKTLYQLERLP